MHLVFLVFFGCSTKKPYQNTYVAVHPPSENLSHYEFMITIGEDSLTIGNQRTPYDIIEETPESVILEAEIRHLAEQISQQFKYERQSDRLFLLREEAEPVPCITHHQYMKNKVNDYVRVELTTDMDILTDQEKEMLPFLFRAADLMDRIFWKQAYGDKDELLSRTKDEQAKKYIKINYGPWDRLNGNKPFLPGTNPKPPGARFYPADMSREEFNQFDAEDKNSQYTLIRRTGKGELITLPYHEAFREETEEAARLIREAAGLAEDRGLKKYLNLRAEALLNDEYLESDLAWMDMKDNTVDFIAGPIENYEDQLFGYKSAHEAFILIKDLRWSNKLSRYAELLPELQKSLPVPQEYKSEIPGSKSDLGVYDAVYYAGDCNAGSKTIAINLPNDERVHLRKGSRKLQLKNAMRFKFEKILIPIAQILISPDQRQYINFDAFFENTMFHEVGHGLGIKHTINGRGTVREALKDQHNALEEGKADILGLYLISKLAEMGELEDPDIKDNYVTFMASIFRSIRFGAASSHGKANMIRFYYFRQAGAFRKDPRSNTYRVDFEKMTLAMHDLTRKILIIQGNGDYETARELLDTMGFIRKDLQQDLNRLTREDIPVDIVFSQGLSVLKLPGFK